MRNSADKIRGTGNPNVMVCERGTMFGYSDLIVDPRNLMWMRDANCPVLADITHSLQQPAGRAIDGGGVASGGLRDMIPAVARTCVAVGVDGLFMEVHDDPNSSPVDGPTQWPLRNFKPLLEELVAISKASKVIRVSNCIFLSSLSFPPLPPSREEKPPFFYEYTRRPTDRRRAVLHSPRCRRARRLSTLTLPRLARTSPCRLTDTCFIALTYSSQCKYYFRLLTHWQWRTA